MIEKEIRTINNQEVHLFFDTEAQAYLVSKDAMEMFLENTQKLKESEASKVLILKADFMLSRSDLETIREQIIEQIKTGLLIIPCGFSYEILKRDFCILEEDSCKKD